MRVVSLVPSVTETLRAWGIDPVAVTRFCEQPDLPTVGGTKNPDIAAIAALAPDLVVLDREENRREDAEALDAAGLALHILHVTALDDVAPALQGMARAVGALHVEVAPPPPPATVPSPAPIPVWVPIWRRPWMSIAGDTYGASLLAAAGFEVRSSGTGRYPETTLEAARGLGVALVLAPTEPYSFSPRHTEEMEVVAPVVTVDGQDLFWWGVRTAGALASFRQLAGRWG